MRTVGRKSEVQILLLSDADNTLWDTDSVYAQAQECLLKSVESLVGITTPRLDRLAFVRDVDQDIAAIHHGRLRYPASLLARALSLRLRGVQASDATRIVCRSHDSREIVQSEAAQLEKEFYADLKRTPPLRTGVLEGLVKIKAQGLRPLIVTEGHKKRCEELLSFHELEKFFAGLIEAPKRTSLFNRLFRLHGGYDRGFMIGDQLDRDIAPAKEAGFATIYFPSGFVPKWSPGRDAIQPAYEISSFSQVPGIIQEECVALPRLG